MRSRADNGFSLVETLTVVAIIGVLAVLSIGSLNNMMRQQAFERAVRGTADVIMQARFYAIRTGAKAAATIENQQVIAFVDSNGNHQFDIGETIIARYPEASGSVLPAAISVECITLRERGSGPRTAFFDGRGFYIDAHDGTARHGANICITDSSLGRKKTVSLSIFGNVAVGGDSCETTPFVCPNVAPD